MYKEASVLLDREWLPEEKEVVARLVNNLKYSYMIPGVLKKDINACIKICIRLKDELDVKVKVEENGRSVSRRHSI